MPRDNDEPDDTDTPAPTRRHRDDDTPPRGTRRTFDGYAEPDPRRFTRAGAQAEPIQGEIMVAEFTDLDGVKVYVVASNVTYCTPRPLNPSTTTIHLTSGKVVEVKELAANVAVHLNVAFKGQRG